MLNSNWPFSLLRLNSLSCLKKRRSNQSSSIYTCVLSYWSFNHLVPVCALGTWWAVNLVEQLGRCCSLLICAQLTTTSLCKHFSSAESYAYRGCNVLDFGEGEYVEGFNWVVFDCDPWRMWRVKARIGNKCLTSNHPLNRWLHSKLILVLFLLALKRIIIHLLFPLLLLKFLCISIRYGFLLIYRFCHRKVMRLVLDWIASLVGAFEQVGV